MGRLPVPVETMLSEGALAACELITPTTEAVNPGVCLCTCDFLWLHYLVSNRSLAFSLSVLVSEKCSSPPSTSYPHTLS